jgi:hypothetical protein
VKSRGRNLPRRPLRIRRTVPLSSQPERPMTHRQKAATSEKNQTENGTRKAALAAYGRRTIEEDRMPIPGDRASLTQHGRCGSDPDKKDPSDEHHERHYRVHHDAELAMIGVTPNRMHVRYLGDG